MSTPAASPILILTGPPGSGKSTAANLIAATAARPTVHIHTDTFYDWIKSGFILPWLPESQHQNETVISVIAKAALGYRRGGYDVIIDGMVGPWFLPNFRKAFGDTPFSYVVLRPSEIVAIDRVMKRDREQALRDMDGITKMHAAFSNLGALNHHAIDTSAMTAQETAALVLERVASGQCSIA